MSYCGALPRAEKGLVVESESHILIDACLSHIRSQSAAELPPLTAIVATHGRPPEHTKLLPDAPPHPTPTPRTSVWSVRSSSASSASVEIVSPATLSQSVTARRRREVARAIRWPVFLCGFVAGIFGGLALMKSPVGEKPAVRHAVKVVRRQAAVAYIATAIAKTHHALR